MTCICFIPVSLSVEIKIICGKALFWPKIKVKFNLIVMIILFTKQYKSILVDKKNIFPKGISLIGFYSKAATFAFVSFFSILS